MTNLEPDNEAPLSLEDAANAISAMNPTEEVRQDQPEAEEEQEAPANDELSQEGEEEGDHPDEDQAEGQDDGDSDEDVESDQGRFVSDNAKVRLSDGTVTTIAELKSGSLKSADYTQKTQALAAERQTVTAQSERLTQREKQIEERFSYAENLIKSIIPPAPDPAMADPRSPDYDPTGYISAKANHDSWVQHLNYLEQQKQTSANEAKEQTAAQEREAVQNAHKALLDAVPAFSDEKRLGAFVSDIRNFGTSTYGFKPEELKSIAMDHRQALVMRDAISWRKLQASKANQAPKTEVRPPVQKGGKRPSPDAAKSRNVNAAMERLNKSGTLADATAAILAIERRG